MSPIDALSALSQGQFANADALNGLGNGGLGALANGALNANPPTGGIPLGLTAPVSENFGQILQGGQQIQGVLGNLETQASQSLAQAAAQASGQASAPLAIASSGGAPANWGHMVQQMVMSVNNQQQDAGALVNDVLKGGPTPVHQAMIATEEASLSFEFLAEARNKVLDAYNQIMQMQV